MAMQKKEKRDVLDDLFSGRHENELSEIQQLNELIFQDLPQIVEEEKKREKKAAKERRTKSRTRKKSTHYLTPENFAQLSSARAKIRQKVPNGMKHKISKSQIVNEAIELVLQDLDAKGDKSILLEKLNKFIKNN